MLVGAAEREGDHSRADEGHVPVRPRLLVDEQRQVVEHLPGVVERLGDDCALGTIAARHRRSARSRTAGPRGCPGWRRTNRDSGAARVGSTHRAARCRREGRTECDRRIPRPANRAPSRRSRRARKPVCLPWSTTRSPARTITGTTAPQPPESPRRMGRRRAGPRSPGPGRGRPRSAPRSRPRAVRPQPPATSTASRVDGPTAAASGRDDEDVNSVSDISECSSTRASPLRSTTAARDQAEPVRAGDPSHRPPREHGRPEGEQVLNRDRHRDLVAEHVRQPQESRIPGACRALANRPPCACQT